MAKSVKKKPRIAQVSTLVTPGPTVPSQVKQKKALSKPKGTGAARLGEETEGGPPRRAASRVAELSPDRLMRLQDALRDARDGAVGSVRTQKLLASSVAKMAQKLVEEAAETAIEAVQRRRVTLIEESADLLFNLTVLWHAMKIRPAEVWEEMDRREKLFGLAEKLPKPDESP